tara:strand:+ start:277 stop:447 length:171 start_codon:yes stop_codon:yes gene_type:complete
MLTPPQITCRLEVLIRDLMAATTKPPTKKGMMECQEYILSAYKAAHRLKREVNSKD